LTQIDEKSKVDKEVDKTKSVTNEESEKNRKSSKGASIDTQWDWEVVRA